jgi:hypothetical protein
MKNFILILICAMLIVPELGNAQNKKKSKKSKKAKKEQVVLTTDSLKQVTPTLEAKPSKANAVQAKPSELPKPALEAKQPEQVSKPIEVPPINTEQIVAQSKPIITEKPNGNINWTEQFIEAKGYSAIDNVKFTNPAQAKLMARRGAIVDAQRNLLEIIKGVNVTSETTVNDMITTRDYIYTRLDGVIKGAQLVGEPVEKDGTYEVDMRVPLYESNGLAPAIYNDIPALKKSAAISDVVNQVPPEIKDQVLQGLAFNLNGKKFDPSMFPVIVDENNNLVLDLSKIYDPKTGKFPQIVSATEQVFKEVGFDKGVQMLNVLRTETGKMVIDNKSLKKVNWQKIGQTAAKIGKFIMMLI